MNKRFDALIELRGKGDNVTPLEKALVVLWQEVDGYEHIAADGATDLASLQSLLEQAEQERDALKVQQAQEVDEFNAGYQAYENGLDCDSAEIVYRSVLPADVLSYDSFGQGYAWAKFQLEKTS